MYKIIHIEYKIEHKEKCLKEKENWIKCNNIRKIPTIN